MRSTGGYDLVKAIQTVHAAFRDKKFKGDALDSIEESFRH